MAIQFKKIHTPEPVAAYLADAIRQHLRKGNSVLWEVAGSSSIKVAVLTSMMLRGVPLRGLVVTLTDERYGEPGHKDSNWQQLFDAGFAVPGAQLEPVLKGKSFEETAKDFEAMLHQKLAACAFTIGLFGIGPDGHTSGILPDSPALEADSLVSAYDGGAYQRITTTPFAIKKLDEAVVYAVGKPKWPVLDMLDTNLPLAMQPAQILKEVPKCDIFNDYKGEEV